MESVLERLKKIGNGLVSLQYGVSVACALILLAMIGYQVIVRYILKTSLMGIEELMLFPIIWLYMLGGADASYEKSHIECGILTLYIKKERSIRIFEVIKRTLCIIILAWLLGLLFLLLFPEDLEAGRHHLCAAVLCQHCADGRVRTHGHLRSPRCHRGIPQPDPKSQTRR